MVAPSAAAEPELERVGITDTFQPAQLEVEVGTTVVWRNLDAERHRVRSREGPVEFDSGNLERGETFSFTFSVPGTYPYYDHRNRDDAAYFGTIVVGGADRLDGPLPESGAVSIIDKSFRPFSVAIAAGGSVEWSNDDGEAHTVTAGDSAFDSGILEGGQAFSQTFAEAGRYEYLCLIHPEMRGSIEVRLEEAPVTAEPPAAVEAPAPEIDPTAEAEQATGPDIAGPDLDSTPDTLEATAPQDVPTVSVVERSFRPEDIEVTAGSTVRWSNDDTEGHTVTAREGEFNSGILTVGDEFEAAFKEPGTFDYFCAIHPEMQGTVTVTP